MKRRVKGRRKREARPTRREPLAFQIGGSEAVVVAWYTPESWALLRSKADDPEALDESYEAWLAAAENALEDMRANGVPARRLLLDVAAAADWARHQGERFNSSSRAAYLAAVGAREKRG